jgi:hypothetical protein
VNETALLVKNPEPFGDRNSAKSLDFGYRRAVLPISRTPKKNNKHCLGGAIPHTKSAFTAT